MQATTHLSLPSTHSRSCLPSHCLLFLTGLPALGLCSMGSPSPGSIPTLPLACHLAHASSRLHAIPTPHIPTTHCPLHHHTLANTCKPLLSLALHGPLPMTCTMLLCSSLLTASPYFHCTLPLPCLDFSLLCCPSWVWHSSLSCFSVSLSSFWIGSRKIP